MVEREGRDCKIRGRGTERVRERKKKIRRERMKERKERPKISIVWI